MIYSKKINKIMQFVYDLHNGQQDKSGVPYIYHVIHVAEQMNTEDETIVALLHDTLEDTELNPNYIKDNWGEHILEAVKLLTHKKNEPYLDYIMKIKDNQLARKVKIADLKHNMDLTRLDSPSDKDFKRVEKYKKALEILENEVN
jgi:(p)ppGpp synthase/HD superfamily hydrolase